MTDNKVAERDIKLHIIKSGGVGDVCAETVMDCLLCLSSSTCLKPNLPAKETLSMSFGFAVDRFH